MQENKRLMNETWFQNWLDKELKSMKKLNQQEKFKKLLIKVKEVEKFMGMEL